jgi:peptidoglycan-associated lipoprotein
MLIFLRNLLLCSLVFLFASCATKSGNEDDTSENNEEEYSVQKNSSDIEDSVSPIQSMEAEGSLEDGYVFYFAFDSSGLSNDNRVILNSQVEGFISSIDNNPLFKVKLVGHTDSRGTPEYNLALGSRRAESVSRYLRVKQVPAVNIITSSMGENSPVKQGEEEDSWKFNRRVVETVQE